MERLCDMDIYNLDIKMGDVKIDAEELKRLFECLQAYHEIICNSLDELSADEKENLEQGLIFTEYMQNKYLVLGHLRRSQKQWYDILQKFNDEDFTRNSTGEEVDEARRAVWEMYLDDKGKREKLQREVDERKKELYDSEQGKFKYSFH